MGELSLGMERTSIWCVDNLLVWMTGDSKQRGGEFSPNYHSAGRHCYAWNKCMSESRGVRVCAHASLIRGGEARANDGGGGGGGGGKRHTEQHGADELVVRRRGKVVD